MVYVVRISDDCMVFVLVVSWHPGEFFPVGRVVLYSSNLADVQYFISVGCIGSHHLMILVVLAKPRK